MPAPRALTISHAKSEHLDAAHTFHVDHAGEHLWARDVDDFERYLADSALYIVHDHGVIYGICYVADGAEAADGTEAVEFGGVFVADELRGKRIGEALARTAIAQLYATRSVERLIAHVHVENQLPRSLLQKVGFEIDTQIKAPDHAPATMARNEAGEVWGDEFRFRLTALEQTVNWLESFEGELPAAGSEGSVRVAIDVEVWHRRDEWLSELRALVAEAGEREGDELQPN